MILFLVMSSTTRLGFVKCHPSRAIGMYFGNVYLLKVFKYLFCRAFAAFLKLGTIRFLASARCHQRNSSFLTYRFHLSRTTSYASSRHISLQNVLIAIRVSFLFMFPHRPRTLMTIWHNHANNSLILSYISLLHIQVMIHQSDKIF